MTGTTTRRGEPFRHQTLIGLGLAASIIAAWLVCHVYVVFVYRWTPLGVAIAPIVVALQCWLNVGLFIIAHDCMHGSLAPFRPVLNRWVGGLCLTLYAGFSFNKLIGKHFDHHRHSGTALDPDFHDEDPEHFWRWYLSFFRRYFGWREFLFILAVTLIYEHVFGASQANVLLLWALPAILSSFQLFYFGTYLPHRHEAQAFTDRHKARSNDYPWLISLLTCFHFGYHLEHHHAPQTPWWKLPRMRTSAVEA